jgi:hypothetical protein
MKPDSFLVMAPRLIQQRRLAARCCFLHLSRRISKTGLESVKDEIRFFTSARVEDPSTSWVVRLKQHAFPS